MRPAARGGALSPREADAVDHALHPRQREFAAGRSAARDAMMAIGFPPRSVPMGADRAPVWPEGLVGSITHNEEQVVAAVADAAKVRSLGIDIEACEPLDAELWGSILADEEVEGLGEWGVPPGQAAMRIFSAKEAVYKAAYPIVGEVWEFNRLTLRPNGPNRFLAQLGAAAGPFSEGAQFAGDYVSDGINCLATCIISH